MPVGTYTPSPLANHYTKIYKKCFFISISILGRSGVKEIMNNLVISFNKSGVESLLYLMTKISRKFRHKISCIF